ncbi:MAG: prepilin-type N-terminal cleavage/methylation domain-containing protein [Kiritimatiellia bacterium]
MKYSLFRFPRLRERAFSLVELLVAMGIVMMLVAVLAAVLTDTERAWSAGTADEETWTSARIALGVLGDELSCAVADNILTFNVENTNELYGWVSSEACFVILDPEVSDTNRAVEMVRYWVRKTGDTERYELVRGSAANNCYWNQLWFNEPRPLNPSVVAENVAAFNIVMPPDYVSNGLPEYVDIFLELLAGPDAEKVSDLARNGLNYTNLLERRVKRFTTRVFFNNRDGYTDR